MWIDDVVLQACHKDIELRVWVPSKTMVVLGSSNKSNKECYVENCEKDKVLILKRYGGGGTVVLHNGCLVVSLGLWVKDYFKNKFYFKVINQSLIDSLSLYHPSFKALYQDGLSDLCYQNKKVAGTSIFRTRNYLLYQASILCDKNLSLLKKYLKHPSREPEYRKGKSHKDFVTDLNEIVGPVERRDLENLLGRSFLTHLESYLSNDLISSQESQREYIYRKSSRSQFDLSLYDAKILALNVIGKP